MTHLIGEAMVVLPGETIAQAKPLQEGSKLLTRCGKFVHRRWVLLTGEAECPECSPTLKGLMKSLAGLPREIRRVSRSLEVS